MTQSTMTTSSTISHASGPVEDATGQVGAELATDKYEQVQLPLPDKVVIGKLHALYAITIITIHVLALAAVIPWLFSWTSLILMVVGVHVFGQGINLCYHRQLTHRSFKTPKWLEHFFVVIAICCLEDTPARWVANHRFHHNHSDEQEDPHSPLVTFLWGHVGWLLYRNPNTQRIDVYNKFAKDVLDDPLYMKMEKNSYIMLWIFMGQVAVFLLAGALVGLLWGGTAIEALRMALSFMVWGVLVRTVVVWHITWAVNSITHLFGYRNYETNENSRNNWLVAFLTVGEGWHNNHHFDPAGASVQHKWWEWDITYYEIVLLKWLGLARDVIPPKHKRRAAQAAKNAAPA